MNPDISFIVHVNEDKRELAKQQLERFCVNTEDYKFDPNLISDDCMVMFKVKNETSTQRFKEKYEFSGAIKGKTLIGSIQLWIKKVDEICEFEFWAMSSSVGRACLDSRELRKQLIEFVKKSEGISLSIDWGNGHIEEIFNNKS